MQTTQTRLLQLETQMNAMAQAWLYLAASVEMETGADLGPMTAALRRKRWPSAPDIDEGAQQMLRWLCRELEAARAVRDTRLRYHYRKAS